MEGTVFSAYITNLGKYTEGELVGKWVGFPTSQEEIQEVFREIGIDGVLYEEYFITDYDSEIEGLTACFGAYENLCMLNFLAEKIQQHCDTEWLETVLEFGQYTDSVAELINLVDNQDCYMIYPDVENDFDLGYYLIQEEGLYAENLDKLGVLSNYIDYEAFGRDVRLEEGGVYTGNGCYVCLMDTPVMIPIDGREDIPEEYWLSA